MKTEAEVGGMDLQAKACHEVGGMDLQAKACQGMLRASKSEERYLAPFLTQCLQKEATLLIASF